MSSNNRKNFTEIQIDLHTLERAEERGTNEKEIIDVINTVPLFQLNMGVLGKPRFMSLNRNDMANFMTKRGLKYSYIIKKSVIITVTVYLFYRKWEE